MPKITKPKHNSNSASKLELEHYADIDTSFPMWMPQAGQDYPKAQRITGSHVTSTFSTPPSKDAVEAELNRIKEDVLADMNTAASATSAMNNPARYSPFVSTTNSTYGLVAKSPNVDASSVYCQVIQESDAGDVQVDLNARDGARTDDDSPVTETDWDQVLAGMRQWAQDFMKECEQLDSIQQCTQEMEPVEPTLRSENCSSKKETIAMVDIIDDHIFNMW
jgi:hypothetical protein